MKFNESVKNRNAVCDWLSFDTFIKTIRFVHFKVRKQNLLHIKVYKLNLCNHENEIFIVVLCLTMAYLSVGAQKIYKFQNTKLSDESVLTPCWKNLCWRKIALLGSDLAVPRLGILSCRHHEGLHGLALGGPAAWGGRKKGEDGK